MKSIAEIQAGIESALKHLEPYEFDVDRRTVRFRMSRRRAPGAASVLMRQFGVELALMAASDCCAERHVYEIHYLFAHPRKDWFAHMTIQVPEEDPRFFSMATHFYPASRYEREVRDLFGLEPQGHPDPRPLVRHGFWPEDYYPLRKNSVVPAAFSDDGSPFPFRQVEGEGVYEIPVGPVHAGIIEPGHFRFSCDGETIIDMKERLYFTHKGTEKLFEGRNAADGVELAERISGDTSVGHSLAYCQAVEALSGTVIPDKAAYWRVILLELERLYNHVADFGAIANDTGYAIAHAHCFRIRERLMRLNKKVTGSRLLRGILQPGGITRDPGKAVDIGGELSSVLADFEQIFELCWNNSMLRDRLRGTGKLTEITARDHGVLGYVARASGIDRDERRDHPFAAYSKLQFHVAVLDGGDVEARTLVRVDEIRSSVDLIRQAIEGIPEGACAMPLSPLPAWKPDFGIVEGWRGGIVHWVMADAAGKLFRVKVKDPSFVNWRALPFALLKNIVPDFPLCNKSFNLSYSGNDL